MVSQATRCNVVRHNCRALALRNELVTNGGYTVSYASEKFMKRWIIVAVVGMGIAPGRNKEPRLPEALRRATTVCLEGKTEDARDTDQLAKAVDDWGRLRFGIPGYCDVTFALQHAGPGTRIPHATGLDSDRDYLVFTVWDYRAGSRLYRDVVEWPLFVDPVRSAVKRLRSRIEKQEGTESKAPPGGHGTGSLTVAAQKE